MQLATLALLTVAGRTVNSFIPALVFARRGRSSTAELFTSGRSAPWWLVGVS